MGGNKREITRPHSSVDPADGGVHGPEVYTHLDLTFLKISFSLVMQISSPAQSVLLDLSGNGF